MSDDGTEAVVIHSGDVGEIPAEVLAGLVSEPKVEQVAPEVPVANVHLSADASVIKKRYVHVVHNGEPLVFEIPEAKIGTHISGKIECYGPPDENGVKHLKWVDRFETTLTDDPSGIAPLKLTQEVTAKETTDGHERST